MRLALTDAWRERLRRLRAEQRATMSDGWFAPVEALFPEGVVFLRVRYGHATYLSLDGRVIWWAAPDDRPPRAVDDPPTVANALVHGAREQGLPKLVELLPPPPPGQPPCPTCRGRRWDDAPHPGHPDGTICMICSGLGWRAPRQAESSAAADPDRPFGSGSS